SLWQQTWQGSAWQILDRQVMYLAWALVVVLCLALHPWSARWTGSGRWAHRAALLTGLLMMGVGLVMALLNRDWVPPWAVAALCLAVLTACTLSFDRAPDLVALSAEALMGNVLILGALAHLLFDDGRGYGEVVGELLLLGLVAAGLLAASVTAILLVARRAEPPAQRPSPE